LGQKLIEFLDDIYRKQARYCVMRISPEYRDRMWTQRERRSAQARAPEERGREYILPIVVAAAELPGMQPTRGYLKFSDYPVERIAEILKQKLNRLRPIWLGIINFGLDPTGDLDNPRSL